MNKEQVIKAFNRQTRNYLQGGGSIDDCISYHSKLCYCETDCFDTSDWKKIRDIEYYQNMKEINENYYREEKELERLKFIHKKAVDYKKANGIPVIYEQ